MSCKSCGRRPEGGTETHWLGCPEGPQAAPDNRARFMTKPDDVCEFVTCSQAKRPQGKGPKPKYCGDHSDPKNRK